MKNRRLDQDLLTSQLKHFVADLFRCDLLEPDRIADDEPLLGGSLGLDSFDALELAICIEEEFGVAICGGETSHRAFNSVASLASFIHAAGKANLARPHNLLPARFARQALASASPA